MKEFDWHELEVFNNMVLELREDSSRLKKEAVLEKYLSNLTRYPILRDLLDIVYNDFRQFNLKHKTAMKLMNIHTPTAKTYPILTLLSDLENRVFTGNVAKLMWCDYIKTCPDHLREIAGQILDKDIKSRVGLTVVNKILKKLNIPLIPKFSVALGDAWKGEEVWKKSKTSWHVSRKLDGIRCLAFIGGGEKPVLLSRGGKKFETLSVLEDVLKTYDGPPIVLDGELALKTDKGEDDFQGLMRLIHKKNYVIENPVYYVFDMLKAKDFTNGYSDEVFVDRQVKLGNFWNNIQLFDDNGTVALVRQVMLFDTDSLEPWLIKVKQNKWEGLILRKNVPYVGKRSKELLKVKKMHDLEAVVIDTTNSKMNVVVDGKEKVINTLSSVVIKYRGNRVGVGSGFTLEQRILYEAYPEQIIGKTITVQYFEKTKNQEGQYSLRFPVVKHIFENGRDC